MWRCWSISDGLLLLRWCRVLFISHQPTMLPAYIWDRAVPMPTVCSTWYKPFFCRPFVAKDYDDQGGDDNNDAVLAWWINIKLIVLCAFLILGLVYMIHSLIQGILLSSFVAWYDHENVDVFVVVEDGNDDGDDDDVFAWWISVKLIALLECTSNPGLQWS